MANVLHIFRAPKKRLPMEELQEARVVKDRGLEGCAHARPGNRQVLLVDRETLEAMDLRPGIIRENITTNGLNVNSLSLGQHLRVGEILLRVSAVCHPCDQLEVLRPGLKREMRGRRGMLCRVVQGGTIRAGDFIEKIPDELLPPERNHSSGRGLFPE
jgi:MOSC domain-containing protein YiiM